MKIKLKVNVLTHLQNQNKWTDTELSERMDISRSRLWRARLPEDHPQYCSPGEDFICGVFKAFPDLEFNDIFFLE